MERKISHTVIHTNFLILKSIAFKAQKNFDIFDFGNQLDRCFSTKIEGSNSVSEALGRPPMARNRPRRPLGHVFGPS